MAKPKKVARKVVSFEVLTTASNATLKLEVKAAFNVNGDVVRQVQVNKVED